MIQVLIPSDLYDLNNIIQINVLSGSSVFQILSLKLSKSTKSLNVKLNQLNPQ